MVFKKIIFQNRYVELETPPLHGKNILNFHFDYWNPSLIDTCFPVPVCPLIFPPKAYCRMPTRSRCMYHPLNQVKCMYYSLDQMKCMYHPLDQMKCMYHPLDQMKCIYNPLPQVKRMYHPLDQVKCMYHPLDQVKCSTH